jgi:hypothetical protein
VGFWVKNTLQKELSLCQAKGTNGETEEWIADLLALLFVESWINWTDGFRAGFLQRWRE